MRKIVLINTGGTFNKRYNPQNGTLDVPKASKVLEEITEKWLCDFEIIPIIHKDSLDMTTQDRMELLATINMHDADNFVVIHGTDTIEMTAEYLSDAELDKRVVLTGAMVPYAVDPVEATANLASAVGYLNLLIDEGVHICMNGVMGRYTQVKKDRKAGKFVFRT